MHAFGVMWRRSSNPCYNPQKYLFFSPYTKKNDRLLPCRFSYLLLSFPKIFEILLDFHNAVGALHVCCQNAFCPIAVFLQVAPLLCCAVEAQTAKACARSKGFFANSLHALGDDNVCQLRAIVECVVANCLYQSWQNNLLQTTASKRLVANGNKPVGQLNLLQFATVVEDKIAN